MERKSQRGALLVAAAGTCAAAVGFGLRAAGLGAAPPGAGARRRMAHLLATDGLMQIGLAVAVAAVLIASSRRIRRLWPKLALAIALFFVSGELALRLAFHDGMSFATHLGPLVRRYERDFVFNRFDGPSRGPEIAADAAAGTLRVLVQGDSITWGQGVRDEASLYPALLLAELRRRREDAQMAVLAAPGRNTDAHLAQLRKWGAEIDPDVIVYQWHVNDLDLDKQHVTAASHLPWRRLLCHPPLFRHSYLWFFLDTRAAALWPARSYGDAMLERFAADTPDWRAFEETLAAWTVEARRLCPRVLVLMYTSPGFVEPLSPLRAKVRATAQRLGVEALDLGELGNLANDPRELMATAFDSHPNARVHAAIAERTLARLLALWPELGAASTLEARQR